MATEKQIEYVQKLAKWKQASIDLDAVGGMTDAAVSELIDELKEQKSVRPPRAVAKQQCLKSEPETSLKMKTWNPIQAGMVKKAVADFHGSNLFAVSQNAFADQCLQVYDYFEAADEAIKRKYPEVRQ